MKGKQVPYVKTNAYHESLSEVFETPLEPRGFLFYTFLHSVKYSYFYLYTGGREVTWFPHPNTLVK